MIKSADQISLKQDTYEILDPLGQGAYGIVWRAKRLSDGEIVALKTVQTHNPFDRTPYPTVILRRIIQVLRWEIEFLERIGPEQALGQNILPLLDSGEYEENPVMALPLCRHSLNQVYVQRRDEAEFPFGGTDLLRWIEQIANGLNALHHISTEDGAFIHRDLKFGNVLIKDGDLYLCDFGTVKFVGHDFTISLAGTLEWGAPEMFIPAEVLNGRPRYELTPAVDIYSLGLIIHALLTGNLPAAQGKIQDQTTAGGKPLPGSENKFGTLGGLTDHEKTILQRDIRLLFARGQTLVQQEFIGLPDMETVIEGLFELIASLLSPRAEDRPTAEETRERAKDLRDHLAPQISSLELQMPESISLGASCTIRIAAQGRGLPGNGKWLHVSVAGKPLDSSAIRETERHAWEMKLPQFRQQGEYDVRVSAFVNHQEISDEKRLTVSVAPEQLWEKKAYTEALIQSPDCTKWLDILEKRAGKSVKFRREYLKILGNVREVHDEHVDINRRYWVIRHQLEGETGKSGWSSRWLLAIPVILLVLVVHGAIWLYESRTDHGQGSSDKTVTETGERIPEEMSEEEESSPSPTPEEIRQERIDSLLKTAEEQFGKNRLTTPRGNNAYETYQQVLAIDFENEAATQGIERIADQYLAWANAALAREDFSDAVKYADKSLNVNPWHPGIMEVFGDVMAAYIRRGTSELEKGDLREALAYHKKIRELVRLYNLKDETGDWEAFDRKVTAEKKRAEKKIAAEKRRAEKKIAAEKRRAEEKIAAEKRRAEEIDSLLKTAKNQFNKNYLTLPSGDNAYETCQKIFALEPDNQKAKDFVRRIADQYLTMAERAVKDELREKAMEYVEKGLKVLDSHGKLLGLKAELEHYKKLSILKEGMEKWKRKPERVEEQPGRRRIILRSRPRTLSETDFKEMLAKYNFFDHDRNKSGDFKNDFVKSRDGKTVTDRSTGLMWQQSGSDNYMTYEKVQAYVRYLNRNKFAGYSDWRLPTVEELMSLMEREKVNGLYIDPVFDRKQSWCWSADKRESGGAWVVHFTSGHVYWDAHYNYVRVVRS
ncbi:DUF1566 domain-containing protein [Desulfobacterales bacterium HSG2]|nr:DUF1566 domain-containing protein [Desulfobacterales bacterium HSG2]